MRVRLLFIVFLLLFTIFSHFSLALNIGVSPPLLDLGEIEEGSAKTGGFEIITVSRTPLLIHLTTEKGNIDFFDFRYRDYIFNYSEQDASPWIEFFANPVELKMTEEEISTTPIRASKRVDFLLDVPEDAEPGYHIVTIKPMPSAPPGAMGQAGTQIVPITTVTVMFKVPGTALRKGTILDSTLGSFDSNNLIIDNYFQNTGTDTITARAFQRIYDKNGTFITEVKSYKSLIRPRETQVLRTSFPATGFYLGDYYVFTNVSYISGSVSKNSTITLHELPVGIEKIEFIPIWPIIIGLIIVTAIIFYKRIK